MPTSVIRIDDSDLWTHGAATGSVRIKTKSPISRDLNAVVKTVSGANSLLIDNEAAIKLQILNVLGTPLNSEDFEPTFASSLQYRLYEPVNDVTAFLIEQDTIGALKTWMSTRISLLYPGTSITALPDEDAYSVDLKYVIIASGKISDFGFKLLR